MKFAWIILSISLLPLTVFADETSIDPQDVSTVIKTLEQVPKAQTPAQETCADNLDSNTKISCAKMSDDFCTKLWDPPNNGNANFSTGKILLGNSNESDISMAKKLDLQALIASEARLPKDMRKKAQPILKKLKLHMKKENDSKAWYQKLGQIEDEFHDLINDTAEARTLKRFPKYKEIAEEDRNLAQNAAYEEDLLNVKDEILRAKYQKHPNWLRVKRIFEQAKQDLLAVVNEENFPAELKTKMIQKITTVQLSLPFDDPRYLGYDSDCGTTESNAFYMYAKHKFTICAGYFNTMDNSSLYRVVAHEVSHSYDANAQTSENFMDSSTGLVLKKMCNAKGAAYSCADWKNIKATQLVAPKIIPEPSLPIQNLTNCLRIVKNLEKFDTEKVKNMAAVVVNNTIDDFATQNNFSTLAQPEYHKKKKIIPNKLFLRPDLFKASNQNGIVINDDCGENILPELFTQSLVCLNYDPANKETRRIILDQALKETKQLMTIIYQYKFSYCGKECDELVASNLAKPTSEYFAEWMSLKAFSKYLNREQNLQKRQEMTGLALAPYCSEPGLSNDTEDLAEIEKKYSSEVHPDDRKRRLSIFTPAIIEQVQCSPDAEINIGAGNCKL